MSDLSIDPPGPATVLTPDMTVMELAALLEMAIDAQDRVEGTGQMALWQEAANWRHEVREAFIREFFRVN